MKDDFEITKLKIKELIHEVVSNLGFSIYKILLFGSRSKGNFTTDSDWDLLVIINENISSKELKILWKNIFLKLHNNFPFTSFDLIIKSLKNYKEEFSIVNTISFEATNGIAL